MAALVLGTLLWCGGFLAFTWIINPYGVSPVTVSVRGVNQFKPQRLDIDRLIKPYEVWWRQPRTVFLGTSRINQSVDPAVLDETAYAPAYNASIPASNLGMNVSHLRQYVRLNPRLRNVFVELFLYNFLGQEQEHAQATLADFVRNTVTLFASADTLWDSLRTLWYNVRKTAPPPEIRPGGYFQRPPGLDSRWGFDQFAEGIWKLHETRNKGMQLHEPALASFRELVRVAKEHRLNLVFLLTPNHAYDDYYLETIGAWNTVEDWLLRVSAEATVYSFSQPNAWVYEPVGSAMRYWYDPYHFSLEMGRSMQFALAGKKGRQFPDNFMIRITPDNVAEHIRSRRKAIRLWAQDNPDFVARFKEAKRRWETAR